MALNPNTWRITSEADLDGTPYSKQEATSGRISVVADPLGERGNVCKLYRDYGDALVNSGRRTEIARDVFASEYAFNTGGGWYHTSYMLGEEWTAAIASGELDWNTPPGNSKSALIKQFHPRTADGFTHPMWCLRVSERGVSLHKNAIDDSDTYVAPKAEWAVDTLVWHDVTFGIVWQGAEWGRFRCYLDHKLVYEEIGPQIYAGATYGCWYSEGIYLPGNERNIDRLTIYTQGYAQGYPGTRYMDVCGEPVRTPREIAASRTVRRVW